MWIALMIVGLLLIVLAGRALFPKTTSRSAQLMETYRQLTPELLMQTPKEERIEAVVSNLLAKAEDARKDPYTLIPTLSRERCAVYSLWLLQKETDGKERFDDLRSAEKFGFTELAADGLDLLTFESEAAGVREFLQTARQDSLTPVLTLIQNGTLEEALLSLIENDPSAFCDPANEEIGKFGD